MKTMAQKLEDLLVDEALLEEGAGPSAGKGSTIAEFWEERFVEIAFAEAAEYDTIRETLLREHRIPGEIAGHDECRYGDNDLCFLQG